MTASLLSYWQDSSSPRAASAGGALHNQGNSAPKIWDCSFYQVSEKESFSKFLKLYIHSQNWPVHDTKAIYLLKVNTQVGSIQIS